MNYKNELEEDFIQYMKNKIDEYVDMNISDVIKAEVWAKRNPIWINVLELTEDLDNINIHDSYTLAKLSQVLSLKDLEYFSRGLREKLIMLYKKVYYKIEEEQN